jgi:ribosomal protein S18 acetylase RimI-like enzyme
LSEHYPTIKTSAVTPRGSHPVGFLTGLELPSEYRSQGWETAMLGEAMRIATQQGVREFYVFSARGSVPFYQKLGFRPVGTVAAGPLMRIGLEDE